MVTSLRLFVCVSGCMCACVWSFVRMHACVYVPVCLFDVCTCLLALFDRLCGRASFDLHVAYLICGRI